MIPPVRDNLDAIARFCVKHRVRTLELFGSAACGDFDPDWSDLDFIVEFQGDPPRPNIADQYFGLLFDLEELFRRRVDLATPNTIRIPYVPASVNQTKVPIHAAA